MRKNYKNDMIELLCTMVTLPFLPTELTVPSSSLIVEPSASILLASGESSEPCLDVDSFPKGCAGGSSEGSVNLSKMGSDSENTVLLQGANYEEEDPSSREASESRPPVQSANSITEDAGNEIMKAESTASDIIDSFPQLQPANVSSGGALSAPEEIKTEDDGNTFPIFVPLVTSPSLLFCVL
jgi:hypothetical protein